MEENEEFNPEEAVNRLKMVSSKLERLNNAVLERQNTDQNEQEQEIGEKQPLNSLKKNLPLPIIGKNPLNQLGQRFSPVNHPRQLGQGGSNN